MCSLRLQCKRHNLAVLTHVTTVLLPPFSVLINVYDEIQSLTSFPQLELLKELHTCFFLYFPTLHSLLGNLVSTKVLPLLPSKVQLKDGGC